MNTSPSITLCNIDDIVEGACKSFELNNINLFAVKKGGHIYLYKNSCPHAGLPLNWFPDKFLDRDGELIQCTSHGALFQIETGRCVAGPCPGRHLQSVEYTIDKNNCIAIPAAS